MTYTGKLYTRIGGAFVETGLHTSDVVELTATIKRLEAENQRLRDALAGLYKHTKNDHIICGLNTAAKRALDALCIL